MTGRVRPLLKRATMVAWLVLALLAGPVATARADGDPASDFLLTNQVFVTSPSGSLSAPQRRLLAAVADAYRGGFKIRVAVIASANDLGSVTALWRKPRLYARFLGRS